MDGKIYYLAKNGLEYPEKSDADVYGGGAIKQRIHFPQKKWEPVYDDITPQVQVPTPEVFDAPVAGAEVDSLTKEQLKEQLKNKGYVSKGNPSEATLREKLKLLS